MSVMADMENHKWQLEVERRLSRLEGLLNINILIMLTNLVLVIVTYAKIH